MSNKDQDWVEQYQQSLCPLADSIFRFAISLTMERKSAFLLVQQAYAFLAKKPSNYGTVSDLELVLQVTWDRYMQIKDMPSKRLKAAVFDLFTNLQVQERAALVLNEVLGQNPEKIGVILAIDAAKVEAFVEKGKEQMVEWQPDGDASADQTYDDKKGELQIGLQAYFLSEGESLRLRGFVQNYTQADKEEKGLITDIDRSNSRITWARRLVFLVLLAYAGFYSAQKILPEFQQKFEVLKYLGYEAIALDEDPVSRLDAKIADIETIQVFLDRYPKLGYSTQALANFSSQWQASGASVLDYDFVKVALVQYRRPLPDEKASTADVEDEDEDVADDSSGLKYWQYEYMYQFSFPEETAKINLIEGTSKNGIDYYTFQSEDHNFIVWKTPAGIMHMLAGKESADTLANYMAKGMNK